MAGVAEQMGNKVSETAHKIGDRAQSLGYSMDRASQNLGHRLGEAANEISDKATDYVDSTRQYVKSNPIQSVVIAAAAGLALGSLLTMATRSRH